MENGKQVMCVECIDKKVKEEQQTKRQNPSQPNKPTNLEICKGCNKELPYKKERSKFIITKIFLKIL
jgi:hypothetical protein